MSVELRGGRITAVELEVALLADTSGLTLTVAQVVELCSTNIAALRYFDLLDRRGVNRERTLDSDAVAELADRIRLLQSPTLATDYVTLEDLNALFAALDDAYVDLQFVARLKVGDVATKRVVVDDVGGFHNVYLQC